MQVSEKELELFLRNYGSKDSFPMGSKDAGILTSFANSCGVNIFVPGGMVTVPDTYKEQILQEAEASLGEMRDQTQTKQMAWIAIIISLLAMFVSFSGG